MCWLRNKKKSVTHSYLDTCIENQLPVIDGSVYNGLEEIWPVARNSVIA